MKSTVTRYKTIPTLSILCKRQTKSSHDRSGKCGMKIMLNASITPFRLRREVQRRSRWSTNESIMLMQHNASPVQQHVTKHDPLTTHPPPTVPQPPGLETCFYSKSAVLTALPILRTLTALFQLSSAQIEQHTPPPSPIPSPVSYTHLTLPTKRIV